ncbi:MAG: ABC transporter permease [Acidobacteria bacterium]|nr:ABC transporter permease [Acidobacteriota bacterium]
MNAVVLRAVPVPEPGRVVSLNASGWARRRWTDRRSDGSFPLAAYEQLRADRSALSDVMDYVPLSVSKTPVRVGSETEEAEVNMVSGNLFSGLGVPALCGRTFTGADETNHTRVAVLSHSFWNRRFCRQLLGRRPAMLFGVEPSEPHSFSAGIILIALVALLASLLNAQRAAATEPIVALRYE